MEVSHICSDTQDLVTNCARCEALDWLDPGNSVPVWSRLSSRNASGRYRGLPVSKYLEYDVEIERRLWSIWGSISPIALVFSSSSRGKQFLACNVIACVAASLYQPSFWTPELLDSIVISGDQYHCESLQHIKDEDYEFSIDDLGTKCMFRNVKFTLHLEYVAMGKLYYKSHRNRRNRMNLADALMYFFTRFQYGILQCENRSLAFGNTRGAESGYFMFDCQSRDHPIFPKGQGASYLLRTTHLQFLVYCIVITLNVRYYKAPFTLHKVDMVRDELVVSAGEMQSSSKSKCLVDLNKKTQTKFS